MNILITQSNYIPWKGYFDNIAKADAFVVYDDMQYTRRDWRNRNLIKTSAGLQWLTVPVEVRGKFLQKINETLIADDNWQAKHLAQLRHCYSKAACFREMIGWVEEIYMTAVDPNLSVINIHFLQKICSFLNIKTKFINSKELEFFGNRTEKLVNICTALGANKYFTGPAAKNYMEENIFEEKGISIEYFDYGGYPEYSQLYPPFEHGVTILDLIFNCGTDAKNYMKHTNN